MTSDKEHIKATRINRLKMLIEASQALAQIDSLNDLLPKLLNMAQEVTDAEAASILLYKPETDTLEFTLAINDYLDQAEKILSSKFELKMGEGIAGHVAMTRRSIMVEDAYKDERFFGKADKASGFITKSLLCVPIVQKDELLGVVQVLNSRGNEFFNQDDLDVLESFAHLAAVAIFRSKLLESFIRQQRMQVQLDAAARIQSNFLPSIPDLSPGRGIWAKTKPAIFVGGDFYDCIPMADDSYVVCVADVSGKGLPAALVGAALWTRLRGLAPITNGLEELLGKVNFYMYDVLAQELFATIIIGRFWPSTGRVDLVLAGHLPPVHVRSDSLDTITELKGPPIGIDRDIQFSKISLSLAPGDSLLFITDGVTEARNSAKEFFGEERMAEYLRDTKSPPYGPGLMDYIETWRGSYDVNDDITVLEMWLDK